MVSPVTAPLAPTVASALAPEPVAGGPGGVTLALNEYVRLVPRFGNSVELTVNGVGPAGGAEAAT